MRPTHRRALVATVMLCLAIGFLFYLLLDSSPAHAQPDESQSLFGEAEPAAQMPSHPLSLRLEPGVALALSSPQSDRTNTGFGQTIKLFIGLNRFLEVGPSATFTTLPSDGMGDAGTSWSAGGGARLLRPRDAAPGRTGLPAISPWLDADLLYVRTGELDRLGFATAIGASVPLDQRRRLWLGPYVRYFQIVQGERDGFDNRDAKLLTIGLSLEISPGLRTATRVSAVAAPPHPIVAEAPAPEPAPLPIEPVAVAPVQPEKIEVKQKIAFEWNSTRLRDDSGPALDEVVVALQQNPAFRVDVEGHASSDGGEEHNQTLSEGRALSVLDYLAAHGVARERLTSRGFSSSAPLQSNSSLAGRQANRRVEFTVSFILVSQPAGQGSTPLQQGSTP